MPQDEQPREPESDDVSGRRSSRWAQAFSRRELVCGAAATVVLIAVGGVGLTMRSESLLRPVGAGDEDDFLSLCLRCDRCRSACPLHAIVVASVEDGLANMRTPKLDFHSGYCDFCGSKEDPDARPLCVANCPTDALGELSWKDAVLGIAVIDQNECIAYEKVNGCKVCVDACPYGAVYLNDDGKPEVDAPLCNGCGYCEFKCPSHTYRSYSGSANRGIYVQPLSVARTSEEIANT